MITVTDSQMTTGITKTSPMVRGKFYENSDTTVSKKFFNIGASLKSTSGCPQYFEKIKNGLLEYTWSSVFH